MTGYRIAVLICGPFCIVLATLSGWFVGLDAFEAARIVVIASIGGWILGRGWR